jgi:hypothetical protein
MQDARNIQYEKDRLTSIIGNHNNPALRSRFLTNRVRELKIEKRKIEPQLSELGTFKNIISNPYMKKTT